MAFGGNLGRVEQNLRAALVAISELPQTRILRVSSLYRSAPVGIRGQPDFFNLVLRVRTGLRPAELLASLLEIERRLGRTREIRGGPRTVDLDLLLWGDLVIDLPGLRVPHPRMHERGFVLVPLNEIDPDARHPELGRTAREMLRDLGPAPDVIRVKHPAWAEALEEKPDCPVES